MFRTIKVHINGNIQPLIETAVEYRKACQLALDYGFKHKIHDKGRIHEKHTGRQKSCCPNFPPHWYNVQEIRHARC